MVKTTQGDTKMFAVDVYVWQKVQALIRRRAFCAASDQSLVVLPLHMAGLRRLGHIMEHFMLQQRCYRWSVDEVFWWLIYGWVGWVYSVNGEMISYNWVPFGLHMALWSWLAGCKIDKKQCACQKLSSLSKKVKKTLYIENDFFNSLHRCINEP